jgi:hypothetical protein
MEELRPLPSDGDELVAQGLVAVCPHRIKPGSQVAVSALQFAEAGP